MWTHLLFSKLDPHLALHIWFNGLPSTWSPQMENSVIFNGLSLILLVISFLQDMSTPISPFSLLQLLRHLSLIGTISTFSLLLASIYGTSILGIAYQPTGKSGCWTTSSPSVQLKFSFYNPVFPRLIQLVLFCIWDSSHPKEWKIVPSNYRWSLDSLAWNMRSLGSWHDWPLLSCLMSLLTLYLNFQLYPVLLLP